MPSGEFHVGSVWNFAIPSCRVLTALGEVVCYRTEGCDDPNLRSLFAQAFDALEPGGLFVFDITEIGLDRDRDRTFSESDDWACLVRYEYEERRHRLHRHITSFRKVDSLFRRSREHHIVQLYSGDAVTEMLEGAGFKVRRVRNFGSAALLPMRLGSVAHRNELEP